MTLKIISAESVLFEGEVKAATLPGQMGEFTVLRNHASLVALLAKGQVRYRLTDDTEQEHEIPGGVAEIDNNIISVCVY